MHPVPTPLLGLILYVLLPFAELNGCSSAVVVGRQYHAGWYHRTIGYACSSMSAPRTDFIVDHPVALSVFMFLAGHFFFNLLHDRSMHDVPASDDSTVTITSKYTFSSRLKVLSVALVTITTLLMIR